jgi:hypothetical protein
MKDCAKCALDPAKWSVEYSKKDGFLKTMEVIRFSNSKNQKL